eukprot:INCI7258.2.p1 GENE.INCI7258.2~~INCI7258.2.p1  ORF type:complete len:1834 (-),score=330.43 INCI7258.2:95-5596(-)
MASARKRSLFAAGAAQIAFATGGVRAVQRTRASASGTEKDERSKKQKKNMSQLLHEPVKALTSEEKKRRAKLLNSIQTLKSVAEAGRKWQTERSFKQFKKEANLHENDRVRAPAGILSAAVAAAEQNAVVSTLKVANADTDAETASDSISHANVEQSLNAVAIAEQSEGSSGMPNSVPAGQGRGNDSVFGRPLSSPTEAGTAPPAGSLQVKKSLHAAPSANASVFSDVMGFGRNGGLGDVDVFKRTGGDSINFDEAKFKEQQRGKLIIPDKATLDEVGLTVLTAAQQGKYRLIASMVRDEVDVNVAEPDEGFTALMYAATYDDVPVALALLRSPIIDINARNRFGSTALMVGLEAGGTNAAREIAAQAGALLNVEAFNGMTAFRIAMKKANSTAMEFLLKTKRLQPAPKDYRKAVRVALREKFQSVLSLLLRKKACHITQEERREAVSLALEMKDAALLGSVLFREALMLQELRKAIDDDNKRRRTPRVSRRKVLPTPIVKEGNDELKKKGDSADVEDPDNTQASEIVDEDGESGDDSESEAGLLSDTVFPLESELLATLDTAFDVDSFHRSSVVAYKQRNTEVMTRLLQRPDFHAPVATLRRVLHWALDVGDFKLRNQVLRRVDGVLLRALLYENKDLPGSALPEADPRTRMTELKLVLQAIAVHPTAEYQRRATERAIDRKQRQTEFMSKLSTRPRKEPGAYEQNKRSTGVEDENDDFLKAPTDYSWKNLEFEQHSMRLVEPLDVFIALRRSLMDFYASPTLLLKVLKTHATIEVINETIIASRSDVLRLPRNTEEHLRERRLRQHTHRRERVIQFLQKAGANLMEGTGLMYEAFKIRLKSGRPITLTQRCGVWWTAAFWLVDLLLQAVVAYMVLAAGQLFWGSVVLALMLMASVPNLFDARNGVDKAMYWTSKILSLFCLRVAWEGIFKLDRGQAGAYRNFNVLVLMRATLSCLPMLAMYLHMSVYWASCSYPTNAELYNYSVFGSLDNSDVGETIFNGNVTTSSVGLNSTAVVVAQVQDLLFPTCPLMLELPISSSVFAGLAGVLSTNADGDVGTIANSSASNAFLEASAELNFRTTAAKWVFICSFGTSTFLAALALFLFWDYQILRRNFEVEPVMPRPNAKVSALFAQPSDSPLLAGAELGIARRAVVCESCCMVCCLSRFPLRQGPLQRANEVANVVDVDTDKHIVYVKTGAFAGPPGEEKPRFIRVPDRDWVYPIASVSNQDMVSRRLENMVVPKIGEPVELRRKIHCCAWMYWVITCSKPFKGEIRAPTNTGNERPQKVETPHQGESGAPGLNAKRTANSSSRKNSENLLPVSKSQSHNRRSSQDAQRPDVVSPHLKREPPGLLRTWGAAARGPISRGDELGKWVVVAVDPVDKLCVVQSAKSYRRSKEAAKGRWRSASLKLKAALSLAVGAPKPKIKTGKAFAPVASSSLSPSRSSIELPSPATSTKTTAPIEIGEPDYKFSYPFEALSNARMAQQRKAQFLRSKLLLGLQVVGLLMYHLTEVLLRAATVALVSSMFRILLLAFLVVSAAIRGILMLSRKNQRQKLKREKWLFSFARVAAGTVLDSIWDFPSQTDMVLLTSVEAIFAVYMFTTYSEGLVPYAYQSEIEQTMSLITDFSIEPMYCLTGHAELGAFAGKTLVECWELCAANFDCHSFDFRSLRFGTETINCELSPFRGEDVSPIEYRNCSEFETDVRFQNYEKRDECVGYVSAINIDEGINAGEGGTRDFLLEESGLGQASSAGVCFSGGIAGPDCCFSADNSSTCSQFVDYEPGSGWQDTYARSNLTQYCDWTPSEGVIEFGLDGVIFGAFVVVAGVKLVRFCR